MKTSKSSKAGAENKIRVLTAKAAEAERQLEAIRKKARAAKAAFKQARKALKAAKKAAKRARKELKTTTRSLAKKGEPKPMVRTPKKAKTPSRALKTGRADTGARPRQAAAVVPAISSQTSAGSKTSV